MKQLTPQEQFESKVLKTIKDGTINFGEMEIKNQDDKKISTYNSFDNSKDIPTMIVGAIRTLNKKTTRYFIDIALPTSTMTIKGKYARLSFQFLLKPTTPKKNTLSDNDIKLANSAFGF
jgi:hypothetical protein